MSRKSEIIPIDRRQGHTLDFEFVPRANNHDEIFVVVDGRRIASRGQPGTPEAGIWVSIVPGYTVLDKNDGEDIVVYFDGKVYIQGVGDVIKAFALKLDPATNTMMLDETPVSQGTSVSGFPGEVQSVSANGTTNGIVWEAQVDGFATGSPAILRAYDANDLVAVVNTSPNVGARMVPSNGVAMRFRHWSRSPSWLTKNARLPVLWTLAGQA
jgi:hypothetical protein